MKVNHLPALAIFARYRKNWVSARSSNRKPEFGKTRISNGRNNAEVETTRNSLLQKQNSELSYLKQQIIEQRGD